MGVKQRKNYLACLNCGAFVHWTAFRCHRCGGNPREKEYAQPRACWHDPIFSRTERRKCRRYSYQGKVILDGFFMGELVDLSRQGARFKTTHRLYPDQIVHLDFTVKGIPIQVVARVIHVKRGVLDDRFTLGVHFEAMTSSDCKTLNHHLHTIAGDDPRPRFFA